MARPPRDPSGRSSFCRSSCRTCSGISKRSTFGLSWRQARGEPRDLARDGEVSLHVRGRDGQGIGEVVEAAVRGFIARQLRPDIDVELQEIADRVVVFRAVQALDGADAARIRVRRPCAIDFVFQPQRHRSIGRRIRSRPSRRRHRTGTQFPDHFFPDFGVRAGFADVLFIEGEARRFQFVVVAGDAIGVEYRPRGRLSRGALGRRGLARRGEQGNTRPN